MNYKRIASPHKFPTPNEAREIGKQMADKVAKKLKPFADNIAKTINDHDQRLVDETRLATASEILKAIEENCSYTSDSGKPILNLDSHFWQEFKIKFGVKSE